MLNIKVIQATDFIRATPEGKPSMEKAEQLLKGIAAAGAGLEGFHVLVDGRRITGALTATELWYLADKLVRYRRTFENKTAILCPVENFDHAQFFALCAEKNTGSTSRPSPPTRRRCSGCSTMTRPNSPV
jgi:hypothetical protein